MRKSEAKEAAKLALGILAGFLGNRYVSRSKMVTDLYKDAPELASVTASAGITAAAIKFGSKIKDKSLQAGVIGGSAARTIAEVLQIPAIASKLPAPIVPLLFGDSAFGEKAVTVGSDELEKFINMEAQKRAEMMIPAITKQIETNQTQTDETPIEAETETDETFGGDEESAFG